MITWSFICVGGPLDGQLRPQSERQTSFEVVEKPDDFDVMGAYNAARAVGPVEMAYKHIRYDLQEHPVHGSAWVCQP